jgi:cytochrome c-type biogenesis protein CcmH/NrfG
MPLQEKEIEEHRKAIAKAETAVQNNPTNFDARIELGMAYFHAEQLQKALAAFQQASELDPTDYAAYSWIGRVYERRGQAGPGSPPSSRL